MSPHKKLLKAIQNLFREMVQIAKAVTKKLMNWLLRSILVTGKKANLANAGFILPTVTMVILVVILLTTAMVFRSFERSKNASNVRVSQATLAAATPALDRAKAKISALLADPTLPRATPTDIALNNAISGNIGKYTLGDETRLVVQYDIDKAGGIQPNTPALDNDERITTAWRFPVDTDNDGRFDSFTLYGIYFRTPNPLVRTANPSRSPIEARTPPQDDSNTKPQCRAAQGTFAGLVGSSGWYKSGSVLKKSFYVFATTVPFTSPTNKPTNPQVFPPGSNRGFSAIEYQQDRAQIPLSNNAVVYNDDLEITPGSGIKLNGRIQTNGNLITAKTSGGRVEYYQVSSYESCFFEEENGEITVGGNVILGSITGGNAGSVSVDLYDSKPQKKVNREEFQGNDQSVSGSTPIQAAYNSEAFAERINILVRNTTGTDPSEVQDKVAIGIERTKALQDYFKDRMRQVPFAEDTSGDQAKTPQGSGDTLRPPDEWIYPVEPSSGASNNNVTLQRDQPEATERTKQEADDKETYLGDRILVGNGLPAIWWDKTLATPSFVKDQGKQTVKPDTPWDSYDTSKPDTKWRYRTTQVVPMSDLGDTDRDGFWERNAAVKPNQPLDGVGGLRVVTGAGVYTGKRTVPNSNPAPANLANAWWSFLPQPPPVIDDISTTNIRENLFTPVWPDSMPMWEDTSFLSAASLTPGPDLPGVNGDRRGDLVMRATAVYHYKRSSIDKEQNITQRQAPIACVSSYYDPSTSDTARNRNGLPWQPQGNTGTRGLSNNGISYPAPQNVPNTSASPNAGTGLFPLAGGVNSPAQNPADSAVALLDRLYYQANLIFPNGRFVNQPLREALTALSAGKQPTLAQQSALDATVCAFQIADGTLSPNSSVIPHGTIYETSFLDARQIKAIDRDPDTAPGTATFRAVGATNTSLLTKNYDLPLEERQPLEVRVTALDLNQLRKTPIAGGGAPNSPSPEYLLPDSGIIYATRDDALLDLSALTPAIGTPEEKMAERKSTSSVDFKLDPTRRPNGIMLVNGSVLARGGSGNTAPNTYALVNPPGAEKGLILATNLPAYVKADETKSFNKHQTTGGGELEEFSEQLGTNDYAQAYFYGRKNPENRFACRSGQPGIENNCPGGDLWRQATVLGDSVTLLSDDFRFGFRNEGDYDLRNNQGDPTSIPKLKQQGFLSNNFVTNGLSSGAIFNATKTGSAAVSNVPAPKTPDDLTYTGSDPTQANYVSSSYFNNFVTPIQRRGNFPEYLMEMCVKLPVSDCGPGDWYVDPSAAKIKALTAVGASFNINVHKAGTTARTPAPLYQRYARRVAFLRNASNQLVAANGTTVLTTTDLNQLVPLGIVSNSIAKIPYGASTLPTVASNALWFKTTTNNATPNPGTAAYGNSRKLYIKQMPATPTEQPILEPVLQFHVLQPIPPAGQNPDNASAISVKDTLWVQKPTATGSNRGTIFNLLVAGGDSPSSGGTRIESNGGLQNFVRFIENWYNIPARISGSFIQFKRSTYATAPFTPVLSPSFDPTKTPFGYTRLYTSEIFGGKVPFYVEPKRYWGFDVALLSQLPDLFSQRFTTPSAGDPNEFYREVGRDDEWVKTLLCAKLPNNTPAIDTDQRPPGTFCRDMTGG
ncbi:hypothetical protein H6F74_00470 [Trichocoleus sp. FACHB-90]|uniref:hormogonium polysaccharide biosynthesis protein HpsA n=1 Tax=Cyanophyceae TaxID=3028117 RepID=UPI0016835F43|nr:hormogonium polysaccharide biosynthesis protein HpsA [Trichocoleus sp. FACHB-90]MBD1924765.1 hypothetical protein [Trichocoleus sp. FACHB-90]